MKENQKEAQATGKRSGKEIILRENGTVKVHTINVDPSLTDQQFKDDTDVNKILSKFIKNGTPLPPLTGRYLDLSTAADFQQAMEVVVSAETAFQSLDARVRQRFGNSPEALLAFLEDPANDDEAIKLGLRMPKKDQSPTMPNSTGDAVKNDATNATNNNG